MSVIGSCGHELTEKEKLGIPISIKDNSRDGSKAISYICVCDKCFKMYKKKKLILETKKEEAQWLGISKKPKRIINFDLCEDQIIKLEKWQKKIEKKYGNNGLYEYRFTPTGIGDCVSVYSKLADKSIDLTELDKW